MVSGTESDKVKAASPCNLRGAFNFRRQCVWDVYRNEIVYVTLHKDNGETKKFIGFGPVAIRPDCQGQGLGKNLILHSMKMAEQLSHEAVFITGNSKHYHKLGFESASKYGIYLDENRDGEFTFFMVKPLVHGALKDMEGILKFDESFEPSKEETEEFDKDFPEKIKETRPGQLSH